MIYLTYGIPKTASTYCYQMIRLLCIAAGWEQPDLPDGIKDKNVVHNFINPITSDQLDELVEHVSEDDLIVVKTHSKAPDNLKKYIEQGVVYACASYRDPRDIALSLVDAGERIRASGRNGAFTKYYSIEDTILFISKCIDEYIQWVEWGALPVYYDELCFDTKSFLKSVCRQLSIPERHIKPVLFESYMLKIDKFNRGIPSRHKHELSGKDNNLLIENFGEFISRCEEIIVKLLKLNLIRNKVYSDAIQRPSRLNLARKKIFCGLVWFFRFLPG